MKIPLYGFTLLKNGLKYDYPFKECLNALTQLCQESYIALGDSEDGTEEHLGSFTSLNIVNTVWDMSLMGDGGKILSQQTNVALDKLRQVHSNGWAFYLQTDELIHEKDFDQIKKDIKAAEDQNCDAVSFRYYHFWLNHNQVAISKRWYPQEVRAIKVNSMIVSHGDAQGFSGCQKVYESDVHIFHYGHVRDKEKREAKQELLIKMIRPDSKFKKYKSREEKAFKSTETLPYFGPHPKWMKDRIERFGDIFRKENHKFVKIHDPENFMDEDLKNRIAADKIEVSAEKKPRSLSLEPSLIKKLLRQPKIPIGMKSSLARPWSNKQRIEFLLWKNEIST